MNEPDTTTTPVPEPETRSVLKPDIIAILGVGVALIAVLVTATGLVLATAHRIENQIASTNARLDSAIAEAAADRRAFQASMDQYRRDMQRLGERQARLEG